MGNSNSSVRYASPNERRVIIREDLGYYRSLFVGGVYHSQDTALDLAERSTYLSGLRKCLKDHPPLSVIVKDTHTEKPYYTACAIADLSHHIEVLPDADSTDDELHAIEKITAQILDDRPPTDRPPWKIVVLPFASADASRPASCFIAFAFSHSLGDGISGLAFHKSLLAGLRDPSAEKCLEAAKGAMPEPFDTRKNLPITLSYLLAPALGQYLPKFLSRLLGLRAAVSTITESTWLGNNTVFLNQDLRAGAKVFQVDGIIVAKLIEACRQHHTKLTSLIHQVIIYSLSSALSDSKEQEAIDSFASQTAINMRHHVNTSNDLMGLYVSGYFDVHARPKSLSPARIWADARDMNNKLHECSRTLKNQSIGLLRFLLSIRSWTTGHMDGNRDASYEVSNLLAFEPESQKSQVEDRGQELRWSLGNMVFAQPANVTGAPLCFNVVARKGGDLVCTITWQLGALGVGDQSQEIDFVDHVTFAARDCIEQLTSC